MGSFSFNPQQGNQQDINYRVTIDRADVFQAISEIEAAANKSAQSVSALSSNLVSNVSQTAQAGMAMGQMPMNPMAMGVGAAGMQMGGMGPGSAIMPGMAASSLMMSQYGPGGRFNPGYMMGRDAMMAQYMSMGPSSGYGPSMTTPWGTPAMDVFRNNAGAAPYQVPASYISSFAPIPNFTDPNKSRLAFGVGQGSMLDAAFMTAGPRLFGGIGNNNREDLMFRNIDRGSQFFAENLVDAGRYFGSTMGAGAAGAYAGGALGTFFGGPVGTVAGATAGGILGSVGGELMNRTIDTVARPYMNMAQDVAQYGAPYMRGNRIGGGVSMGEQANMQKQLGQMTSREKWFTAQEMQDLVKVAGETGLFQMTGSQDQALQAIEKLASSTKALYAVGMKAREHMKAIDQSLGTFGISAGHDPQMFANFMTTMAVTAQSAGMSTGQMMDHVAPAAQMFASQGINQQAGARIAGNNMAISGELFRSGALGADAYAYYGGREGFANSLTSAQGAMMRTPFGNLMNMSLFQPGLQNLRTVMTGGRVGINEMIDQAGITAGNNPLRHVALGTLMPRLTQNMGPELQMGQINAYVQAYRDYFNVPEGERIVPEDFMAFLQTVVGLGPSEASAMYDMVKNLGTAATGMKRSAQDQKAIARAEEMRLPGPDRALQKFYERNIAQPVNNLSAGINGFTANIKTNIAEYVTGQHLYRVGADGTSGFASEMAQVGANKYLAQVGATLLESPTSTNNAFAGAGGREGDLVAALVKGDASARARFIQTAKDMGYSDEQVQSYLAIAQSGGTTTQLDGAKRQTLQQIAESVTGASGTAAVGGLKGDALDQFRLQARNKGLGAGEIEAFMGNGLMRSDRRGLDAIIGRMAPGQRGTDDVGRRAAVQDYLGRTRGGRDELRRRIEQAQADGQLQGVTSEQIDEFIRGQGHNVEHGGTVSSLDLATDRQLTGIGVELLQDKQDVQTRYINAISGMRGFDEGSDGSDARNSLAGSLTSSVLSTKRGRIQDVLRQAREGGGDYTQNALEGLSKEIFGQSYGKLSGKNQATLGAMMREMGSGRHDLGGEERTLYTRTTDIQKEAKNMTQMSREEIEKRRRDIIFGGSTDSGLGGAGLFQWTPDKVAAALDVSGQERVINTDVMKKMFLSELIGQTNSEEELRGVLKSNNLSDEEIAAIDKKYGLANMSGNRAGLADKVRADITAELGGLEEGQQRKLTEAWSQVQDYSKALGGRKFLGQGLRATGALERNFKDLQASGPEVMSAEARAMFVKQFGGSLGGDTESLLKAMMGGDIDAMDKLAKALKSSPETARNLGVDGEFFGGVTSAIDSIKGGGAMSEEDLIKVLKPVMGDKLDATGIKDMAQKMRADMQAGGDTARSSKNLLMKAMGQVMSQGATAPTMSGDKVSGGAGSPEHLQAMQKSADAMIQTANQMERISQNFAPAELDKLITDINELQKNAGKDMGAGAGAVRTQQENETEKKAMEKLAGLVTEGGALVVVPKPGQAQAKVGLGDGAATSKWAGEKFGTP